MKKLVKIGIAVAAVGAIGVLAYRGLKTLLAQADRCGCCDGECQCDGDGYMGSCECECHCCDEHTPVTENVEDKAESTPAEQENESPVDETVAE